MTLRSLTLSLLAAVVGVTGLVATKPAVAAGEQFIPMLVYRTGPYAPSGIPVANGFRDYYTLINKRDGGVNGVTITFEECETKYNTKLGVECYEKLKNKGSTGASLVNPFSTGITYQLIPKAPVDKVPILSMGYGHLGAAFIVLVPVLLTNAPQLFGVTMPIDLQKHIEVMLFGSLIIFFLIVEPRGLARLWQIAKEKLRLWPFPY